MSRSRIAVLRPAAALLAALLAVSAAAESFSAGLLKVKVLQENDLASAEAFLGDEAAQDALNRESPALHDQVFARAAELKDLAGVLTGESDAHSIRLSLLSRQNCAFCLDAGAYKAWAKKNLGSLKPEKYPAIDAALWSWETLKPSQRQYAAAKGKQAAWPALKFADRHALLRAWALAEKEALLKLDLSDPAVARSYHGRAWDAYQVLSSHEMSEVWQRGEKMDQANASLAAARAKLGANADPKQKALLAQAIGAGDPSARLAALARLFEGMGEHPRELLEAAPPKENQKFDDRTRGVVGEMLKTALLKETEGTFAGDDLKAFYAKTPLTVTFTTTSMSALGWYSPGGDTLYFNQIYVEQYIKSRQLSIEQVMGDQTLLADLARTLVGTFVHEAQHHRQDVWARENKIPRLYHQGDEVEAFQTQALFLLQKMKTDPKFKEFADREGDHSAVLSAGLGRARHMEAEGPDYFSMTVPNAHYPEIYSNEGNAWCHILWHNAVSGAIEKELDRRKFLLPEAEQAALAALTPMKESYESREIFTSEIRKVGTPSLEKFLADGRKAAADAPKYYNMIRKRQESVAATTLERYKAVQDDGTKRPPKRGEPPPPPPEERK